MNTKTNDKTRKLYTIIKINVQSRQALYTVHVYIHNEYN
jgi:hypothetical protein